VGGYNELLAVSAGSPRDVWAVGYFYPGRVDSLHEGTLTMHWDGAAWMQVPSPNIAGVSNRLTGVAIVSKNDAWAVGYTVETENPPTGSSQTITMHWDGNQWSLAPSPDVKDVNNRLYAVRAFSSNDVWAVGIFGVPNGESVTGTLVDVGTTGDLDHSEALIMHWDGKTWRIVDSPGLGTGPTALLSIDGVAAGDIWAVGYHRTGAAGEAETMILHWDGKLWSRAPSPNEGNSASYLAGVTAIDANNVLAVGRYFDQAPQDPPAIYRPLIMRWDGTSWSVVPSPGIDGAFNELNGVAAGSEVDRWVVGSSGKEGANPDVFIAHSDGRGWEQSPGSTPGSERRLNAVTVLPTGEAWAVGASYIGEPDLSRLIMHYSPSACSPPTPGLSTQVATPTPTPTLTSVRLSPVASSTITPAGQQVCTTWSIADNPLVDKYSELLAVSAASPSDVWAVGYHAAGHPANGSGTATPKIERTLTMHWDGKAWTQVPSPNVGSGHNQLTGVAAISKGDAWAVGYTGLDVDADPSAEDAHTIIMHWDGASWALVPSPDVKGVNNRLKAVWAASSSDVWAVGDFGGGYNPWFSPNLPIWKTLVLHWDGATWKQVDSANPGQYGNNLYALAGISSDDLWAVGTNIPTIGGGGGGMNLTRLVLHWNGKEWQNVATPGQANMLSGVAALSTDDVWVVGALGTEGSSDSMGLHWDGTQWTGINLPVQKPPESAGPPQDSVGGIAAVSPHEAWLVGSYGPFANSQPDSVYHIDTLVLHWDGSTWAQVPSPNPTPIPIPGGSASEQRNGLNAVTALRTGEAWAVGSTQTSGVTEPEQRLLILQHSPSACSTPVP
jgi:hypothetical protein